jgi:hypothetical protein
MASIEKGGEPGQITDEVIQRFYVRAGFAF